MKIKKLYSPKISSSILLFLFTVSIFASLIPLPPVAAATTTLGNSSIAGSDITNFPGISYVGPFTAASTGPILSVLVNTWTGGATNGIIGLYNGTASAPDKKLAQTSTFAVDATHSWRTGSGLYYTVTSGTIYWFALLCGSNHNFDTASSGSWTYKYQSGSYPTLPDTASASTGGAYGVPAFYATVFDSLSVSDVAAINYDIGETFQVSAQWTTGGTLSHYIVETNRTGSAVNETAVAFSGGVWSNWTSSWYPGAPGTIAWRIFGNTTDAIRTATSQQYSTLGSPSYSVSSESASTVYAMPATFSAAWTISGQTWSHYIVETNRTGSAANETAAAFSGTWSNLTTSWSTSTLGTIAWKIYANTTTAGFIYNGSQQYSTVTYPSYLITGPYVEDNGAVANQVVSGVVYFTNGQSAAFSLNGTGGTAQTYGVNPAYTPSSVTWQAIANYSYTRVYYLTGTTGANVTVFVPNSGSTPQIYQFTISDFYGVTNPYISTSLNVGGNLTGGEYTIERKPLTVGTVSFVFEQWHQYNINIECDQGTYTVGFSAEGTYLTNINIPAGAFLVTEHSYPTFAADRVDSTTIVAAYTDPSNETTNIKVLITHKEGLSTIVDYNSSTVSQSYTLIWTEADSATDYYVNMTAISDGVTWRFKTVCPALPGSSPWDGVLDFLGPSINTLPVYVGGFPAGVDPAQILAGIIIMAALCVGSFRSAGAACLISWGVGGILIAIGWWQGAVPIWSLAGLISIFILIDEWRQSNGGMMAT